MNANDIEAAKRLIAQFEERADGRHNSTALAIRSTETTPVLVERPNNLPVTPGQKLAVDEVLELLDACLLPLSREVGLRIRLDWQECEIGDYCKIHGSPPFELNNGQQILRMMRPPLSAENLAFAMRYDRTTESERLESYLFEAAFIWSFETGAQHFWKRIE